MTNIALHRMGELLAEPVDLAGGEQAFRLVVGAGGMPLQINAPTSVVDVTLALDTATYADGDVLAATAMVPNFFSQSGGALLLQSLTVLDEDDQGVGFDLVFLDAAKSIGPLNGVPSVSDADARSIIGRVRVSASDYVDLGGCRIASLTGLGLVLKGVEGGTSVFVAAITRGGTPTYSAAGLRLKLGLI